MQAPFGAAARRLAIFVRHGTLRAASEAAYQGGLDAALLAAPGHDARGPSKLVRVRYAEPIQRGAVLQVPLRWETTGTAGELFSVLDADLTLTGNGERRTHLRLDGSYRAPFGQAGAALDGAALSRIVAATIRGLLDSVADAIADPAAEPQPGAEPASRWWPEPDTGEP